ncbi:PREDICTED: uncharacterized protein LOC105120118 isoform X3 [Populus euphratica]|uniref:Uncharacterized protein LOC105108126 isoform X4 n=1 Tax=Populus euphratica TaxID=75702 RepID=A0AAJ6SX82_POPEU|nr:PREDICTED: uncharacterized protein LOC105108126 isoform X4 [Populus euphratica]XP_011016607.1 PREDICTED: uncharacterized protein LOC105120118 isoform X3 [Populus euphratica]XP_011016608.1 PREDICTED: uncharacterized protein LOC105120118 isoform X3 [Populus euphratica]
MALVPKEVDYYEGSVLPFPSKAFGTYRGVMEENYVRIPEVAKGELNLACMVAYGISNRQLLAERKRTVFPGGGCIQKRGVKSSALLFRSLVHFRYLAWRIQ